MGVKKITEEQVCALIRRLDKDGDPNHYCSKDEFCSYLYPQEPHSKALALKACKYEEDFGTAKNEMAKDPHAKLDKQDEAKDPK